MAITHLKIEQASTGETVSAALIEKLAEMAKGNLDAESNLSGVLNANKAYRDSCEFLVNKFSPNLGINVVNYLVRFNDPNFMRICASVLGSSDGVVTEAQADAVHYFGNIEKAIDSTVREVDLNLFPNAYWFSDSNASNILHNVILDKLDFGNVTAFTNYDFMSHFFNIRIADTVIVDVCVGENVEKVGVYQLRNFMPRELYLPNVKYLGNAQGAVAANFSINGTSVPCKREFVFLGDKIVAFGGLNDDNAEQYRTSCKVVITALTPPAWAVWAMDAADDAYTQQPYAKYKMGSYCYYVPDAALNDYKQAPIWSNIWADWGTDCLKPISELSAAEKQKISKWYTEPTPNV